MANTVTVDPGGVIAVVLDGATDLDLADYFPNGIRCSAIDFVGSAATDVLKVRSKSASGSFLVPLMKGAMDQVGFVPVMKCSPYILATDLTLSVPASCLVTFYYV